MDNLSLQIDEVEVLKSIYGNEFKVESERGGSYSIKVAKDVDLFFSFVDSYPSDSPPEHLLLAPSIDRSKKKAVAEAFREIYMQSGGGPVIYQWVEKLRDIAFENAKCNSTNNGDSGAKKAKREQKKEAQKKDDTSSYNIIHGPIIVDRKSTFQAHACSIKTKEDVDQIYEFLLENKKIAQATHNVMAYRLVLNNGCVAQEFNDDGENQAGCRLLHMVQVTNALNVLVVVTRWYGGTHLGPDRFRHYNNAARQVLHQGGFL